MLSIVMSLLMCFSPSQGEAQFYDGSNMSFGKNRIQYRDFTWQYYRFDKFDTYFYEGGKDLAAYVSEVAPHHIRDIQNKLDYVLQDRIEFIIYNTQSDFRQSNLGLVGMGGDAQVGGSAQIVGTKVFIYYEGDHESLERNLRAGIARLLLQNLLYGGDWKEVVKNSALLNLPNWYTEGIVSYLVDEWTPEIRDRVADGVKYGRYAHFNRLSDMESVYAGFSIWRYISDVYGPSVIPNILYMTRMSRNVESGFIFVIGVTLDRLFEEHQIYYANYFNQKGVGRMDPLLEELPIKTKKERSYSQFKLSPDGKQAALVSNELGQYRIHLFDIDEFRREDAQRRKKYEVEKAVHDRKERAAQDKDRTHNPKPYKAYVPKKIHAKKIFKAEHKLNRIIDRSYPVLEWNPRGTELAFVTEAKGTTWLNIYSLDEKKVFPRELFGLQKVLSFNYSKNGTQLIFSGVKNGQTDLYKYFLVGNRQEQLTNDIYDDLEPGFSRNDTKVIFTSNRSNDTLNVDIGSNPHQDLRDVFVLDLADRKVLERITSTPTMNERKPAEYDSLRYSYLADRDLIYDRYLAVYDSAISRIDTTIHYRYFTETQRVTHYESNPIEFDLNCRKSYYAQLNYQDGEYRFYVGEPKDDSFGTGEAVIEESPAEITVTNTEDDKALLVEIIQATQAEIHDVDIRDYRFIGESEGEEEQQANEIVDDGPVIIDDIDEIIALQSGVVDTVKMELPKPRNYELNFAVDQADLDLTNSFRFDFYQSYRLNDQNLSPGFSPAFGWGLSDLFEDRRVIGSIGIQGSLEDLAYGLKYDNLLKRLDKSITVQRQSRSYALNGPLAVPIFIKTHDHIFRYELSYPFSEVFSLRSDFMARYQREVVQVRDDFSLAIPNEHNYLGGGKLQLVYDNTIERGLNLFNGTRGKAWIEYYRTLDFENGDYPDFGVIGVDVRHYQKVHRDIILAIRAAGNTSFGQERLISILGGVDNWILPRPEYDNSVEVDATQNYAYQALIMPMRGFFRNARNGTSAAVINTELRVPLFKYLLNKPIQSDFVENFQILGFGDVGSAWTGSGPYADDNSFNTTIEEENNTGTSVLTFILNNQEDPILASYGFGLRSRLLGYFIRADWAWGVVDGRTLPAEFYLSLNLDF